MFFVFEDVPLAPFFDLKNVSLRNPSNGTRLADLDSKRNELLKIISSIASSQSVQDFDSAKVENLIHSSVDLVF